MGADPKPTAEAALLCLQRTAAASEASMKYLREIAESVAAQDAKLATLLLRTQAPIGTGGAAAVAIAPDIDLDGQWGDPVIKAKDPRDWHGPSQAGKRFSECSAEYLDLLAARFEFFNGKEPDETKRGYNTRDAARARGWAARIRAGWKHPQTPAAGGVAAGGFDDAAF